MTQTQSPSPTEGPEEGLRRPRRSSESDVAVIGAGPVGLACAIALKRRGWSATVFDQGPLVSSLVRYPTNMEFFSTPELIEIGRDQLA